VDALTSDRAYRPAWPPDRALALLEAERGAHFDPRCLDAFLALMAERGHRPGGRHHDPVLAEESCHPHPPAATTFPGR
jgi:HD-GYP domain-containing protein (c-di-GMP phosphodiesterase class II)